MHGGVAEGLSHTLTHSVVRFGLKTNKKVIWVQEVLVPEVTAFLD